MFPHLVAAFIIARIFGGASFRHALVSRCFPPILPLLRLFLFFPPFSWHRCAELISWSFGAFYLELCGSLMACVLLLHSDFGIPMIILLLISFLVLSLVLDHALLCSGIALSQMLSFYNFLTSVCCGQDTLCTRLSPPEQSHPLAIISFPAISSGPQPCSAGQVYPSHGFPASSSTSLSTSSSADQLSLTVVHSDQFDIF
ncbi:hypothetical protein F2Q69_00011733 [Brassica cretica]|uniref:Uncharacterized protein n=1 Tax=Brassica cretica TaxID=69181 RepID=A0A8S9QPR5_BRACR|nr:hypothetical protein F2Q69_00011733 [Brassica cretica]